MQLARREPPRQLISLVPMIDVMLILLVFFMVTSTYLNLDMIPVVEPAPESTDATSDAGPGTQLLVRIGADGQAYIRGQPLDRDALTTTVQTRLSENPLLAVTLLPSSRATTQNLVSTMDTLTSAGVSRLRLIRLEAAQ